MAGPGANLTPYDRGHLPNSAPDQARRGPPLSTPSARSSAAAPYKSATARPASQRGKGRVVLIDAWPTRSRAASPTVPGGDDPRRPDRIRPKVERVEAAGGLHRRRRRVRMRSSVPDPAQRAWGLVKDLGLPREARSSTSIADPAAASSTRFTPSATSPARRSARTAGRPRAPGFASRAARAVGLGEARRVQWPKRRASGRLPARRGNSSAARSPSRPPSRSSRSPAEGECALRHETRRSPAEGRAPSPRGQPLGGIRDPRAPFHEVTRKSPIIPR